MDRRSTHTTSDRGGFACPECKVGITGVTDSRSHGAHQIRRRRKCMACGHRFSTYETLDEVVKQNDDVFLRLLPRLRSLALTILAIESPE